jgi:hypothetical protein
MYAACAIVSGTWVLPGVDERDQRARGQATADGYGARAA